MLGQMDEQDLAELKATGDCELTYRVDRSPLIFIYGRSAVDVVLS